MGGIILIEFKEERRLTMKNAHSMDMINGPVLGKILLFALPLALTGMLQVAFNAADIIVIGQFAADGALAAVGACSSLISLLVNFFIGVATGAKIAISHALGAKDDKNTSEHVHNAMTTAAFFGILVLLLGQFVAPSILRLMATPEEVMDAATVYLRIYFLGSPAFLVYNYGAAIIRTSGDTRRPLIYLSLSGLINVLLNLFFILGLSWKNDIIFASAGVAIATAVSHYISAFLIVAHLMREKGILHLRLRSLRIYKDKLIRILSLGIPAGIQSSLFSISNVLIQSNINAFGAEAIAGNTAASSIENFAHTALDAFNQSTLTFIGQNKGAGKYYRFRRIYLVSLLTTITVGLIIGFGILLGSDLLLSLYISESATEAIALAHTRANLVLPLVFIGGMMSMMGGALRGYGKSLAAMVNAVIGICGMRLVWIYIIYPLIRNGNSVHDLQALWASYPFTWAITAILQCVVFFILYLKDKKKHPNFFIKTE